VTPRAVRVTVAPSSHCSLLLCSASKGAYWGRPRTKHSTEMLSRLEAVRATLDFHPKEEHTGNGVTVAHAGNGVTVAHVGNGVTVAPKPALLRLEAKRR